MKKKKIKSIIFDVRAQEGIVTRVFLKYLLFAGAVLILLVFLRLIFAVFGEKESPEYEEQIETKVMIKEDQAVEPVPDPNNFAKRKVPKQIVSPAPAESAVRNETKNPYAPAESDPTIRIKPKRITHRAEAVQGVCADNLDILESAKTLWYLDTDAASNKNPSWKDIVPKYLKTIPVCPRGGVYTIGNSYHEATCSVCGKAHNPSLYSADENAVNGVFAQAGGRYCICPSCHAEIDKKEMERAVSKGKARCPYCNAEIK